MSLEFHQLLSSNRTECILSQSISTMSSNKVSVAEIWKQVRKEREESASTNLLANYENRISNVLTDARKKSPSKRFRKLPRKKGLPGKSPQSSSASKKRPSQSTTSVVKPLRGAQEAVPRHTGRLQILYSYPVEDQTDLVYMPSDISMAPEEYQEKYFENFDIDAREAAIARGPIHHVQEVDEDVQETIRRCFEKLSLTKDALMDCVKQVTALEADRVERLFEETVAASADKSDRMSDEDDDEGNDDPGSPSSPPTRRKRVEVEKKSISSQKQSSTKKKSIGGGASNTTGDQTMLFCQPVHETLEGHDPDYLKLMDSFRKCYCSRCKIFDCVLHGVTESPSLQLSYEVGMAREKDRGAKEKNSKQRKSKEDATQELGIGEENETKEHHYNSLTELTAFHKTICRRFFLVFEGDTKDMSIAMQAPEHLIEQFVEEQGWEVPKEKILVKRPPRRDLNSFFSMRNYHPPWLDSIREGGLRSTFEPCVHDESCEALGEKCSCVKSSVFCTPACSWSNLSRNFFRGCDCNGNCNTGLCTCRSIQRECDPDLCKCDTCTDPPYASTRYQKCQNDSITMRRDVEITIGKSSIEGAGWGAFSRTKFGKGEFIGEYGKQRSVPK